MKKDSETIKRRTWLGGVASVGVIVAGSIAVAQRNSSLRLLPMPTISLQFQNLALVTNSPSTSSVITRRRGFNFTQETLCC